MSLVTNHSTELVGGGDNWNSKDAMVAGPGVSIGHREAKALQEAGEEEEELHAGQGLPQTCSAACGRERVQSVWDLIGVPPSKAPWGQTGRQASPGTCRERHEGLMLHKVALGIQEVFRMEAEGLLPDSLILQHGGLVGDEGRPLAGGTWCEHGLGWDCLDSCH